jgi:ABC-type glycerol-3-phosphate transport system substrate-binding protein
MKMKKKMMSGIMTGFLAALLVLAGCQKKDAAPKELAGSFDADHNWTGEIVEISFHAVNAGASYQEARDTPVAKMLEKKTGVRINWVQVDQEKWALQKSSGDFPDVIRVGAGPSTDSATLIKNGYILPLDDLIEKWGPNLRANLAKQLAVSKAVHGNGEKIYIIPTNTGPSQYLYFPMIRWEWYKELGYPEIEGLDGFLAVLKKMVDAHPYTESGKKVYGVSSFIDWGNMFPFYYPYASVLGYDITAGFGLTSFETNEMVCQLEDDPRSVFWQVTKFLYQANQLGLFDPDTFTQGWNEETAKYHEGQVCFTLGFWDRGSLFATEYNKEGKGFVPVPWKGGSVQGNAFQYLYEMGQMITKNCKYPDAVVRLFDYASSFDGAELLFNGIKGEDWDLVNGRPEFSSAMLDAIRTGVDTALTRGIGYGNVNHLITLSTTTKDPRIDSFVQFTQNPEIAALSNSALDVDFTGYYGASSIKQVLDEAVNRGYMKDMRNYNTLAARLMPPMPTNITRIQDNLTALAAAEWAPRLVYAKNDAEYNSLRAQAIAAFKEAGLDEYTTWIMTNWNNAVAQAKTMGL